MTGHEHHKQSTRALQGVSKTPDARFADVSGINQQLYQHIRMKSYLSKIRFT